MTVYSAILRTDPGILMKVDAETHQGFPDFRIFFTNSRFSAKRTAEKTKSAIRSSGLKFPKGPVNVSITPNVNSNGTEGLDAAIAAAILFSKENGDSKILVYSGLSFDGKTLPLPQAARKLAELAAQNGIRDVIVASDGFAPAESASRKEVTMHQADDLKELMAIAAKVIRSEKLKRTKGISNASKTDATPSQDMALAQTRGKARGGKADPFAGVIGLEDAKRMLSIAAAGRHNVLLVGMSGSGKSLLLSKFANLSGDADRKTEEERAENEEVLRSGNRSVPLAIPGVATISSANFRELFTLHERSAPPIILCHGRYVVADEINQLNRKQLQTLKDACDKDRMTDEIGSYPLRIKIAAAMTLCPCGTLGSRTERCECRNHDVAEYWRPMRDTMLSRFELIIPVTAADFSKDTESDWSELPEKLEAARKMQHERYRGHKDARCNGDIIKYGLNPDELKRAAVLFPDFKSARKLLAAYSVARSVADLDGSAGILPRHAEEARMMCGTDIDSLIMK